MERRVLESFIVIFPETPLLKTDRVRFQAADLTLLLKIVLETSAPLSLYIAIHARGIFIPHLTPYVIFDVASLTLRTASERTRPVC
jgi:hypothetical protein